MTKPSKTPLKLKKLSGRVLNSEQLKDVAGGVVLEPISSNTCGGATCASCSSCNSCVWWTCGDWSCGGTHCFCPSR